jgi:hypothetical protein
VKHLPEPKIHPEDEDSMIPETSEQTIQWPKKITWATTVWRSCTVQEQQSLIIWGTTPLFFNLAKPMTYFMYHQL